MKVYKGKMTDKNIVDRIADGDDKYILTQLDDALWRIQLTPRPDSVEEVGTPVNKALLQEMYDRIMALWNYVYDNESDKFNHYLTDYPQTLSYDGYVESNGVIV